MKMYIMKIKPHFLPLIRNNIKKHEYRLAAPKYDSIKVGDILVLTSNQNKEDYEKVTVEKISIYKTWEEAFKDKWEKDFKGQYTNLDDLLRECHKFYAAEEVKNYGIKVFDIKTVKIPFKNSSFLFDTNIIVQRESLNNCSPEVSTAYSLIDKFSGAKFYHPITKKELQKYRDDKISENMVKKLNAYQELVPSNDKDFRFEEICRKFSQDENSLNDNEILRQVYNGRVDFLLTDDQGIIRKAKCLYIKDKVYTTNEFLALVEDERPSYIDYDFLSVKLVTIGNLNFEDPFFDSLREDYGGSKFDRWLNKKSGEKAYIFKNQKGIQGFLYLKVENIDEDYSNFEPVLIPKKRLKVGTFKINSTGLRLGERFLKIIFDNALEQTVEEIYVTMYDSREEVKHLKSLMEDWGFVLKGKNKTTGEIYLIKDMINYNYNEKPKFNYPLIKPSRKASYLPIYEDLHLKLFPDLHLKNENMSFLNSTACSYAVEKIYVCAWENVNLEPGSLLFVYRIANFNKSYRSVISGVCILNEIIRPQKLEDFLALCKNRTVFSEDELRMYYEKRNYKTIIKVLLLKPFDRKINYKTLKDEGILDESGPRLNSIISPKRQNMLFNLGIIKEEINE